jgi:very-long-chain (3R)-3-hydroxyacyl-CoA dehydratase
MPSFLVSPQASEKYCVRMPNKWNYSFDYYFASLAVLGIYVPGLFSLYRVENLGFEIFQVLFHVDRCMFSLMFFIGSPHMYTYMLGQRKKALAKLKAA